MEELYRDIDRYKRIYKNGNLFIINRKLKEGPVINMKDKLPIEAYAGTLFLIKNNSIYEFYSHFPYEHTNLLSDAYGGYYKCIVTIHNLNLTDVSDFKNADKFEDMDELISYDVEKTLDFMIALIRNGFRIYLKD